MVSPLDYSRLSADVYNSISDVSDWTVIATSTGDANGFYARAYEKGSNIVIAYEGSTESADFAAVAQMNAGFSSSQLVDAVDFYNYVAALPTAASATITTTGHSLGGALASGVAEVEGTSAMTFDATPSISATADYLWAHASATVQASTDQSTFEANTRDAMASNSNLYDAYITGEVATAVFDHSD